MSDAGDAHGMSLLELHAALGRMEKRFDGPINLGSALTLYELARMTTGPILEFGTGVGLSAAILVKGIQARDNELTRGDHVQTWDPFDASAAEAQQHFALHRQSLARQNWWMAGVLAQIVQCVGRPAERPACDIPDSCRLAFVDDDHDVELSTLPNVRLLVEQRIELIAVHDINWPRLRVVQQALRDRGYNPELLTGDIGVYRCQNPR